MTACKHVWGISKAHEGYDRCGFCDTYKSYRAPAPETLYTADYWTHAKGHSTLTEQVFNTDGHREGGKTKNEFILEHIEVADRQAALEVGCAPGRLLFLLRGVAGFQRVVGVEVCPEYERYIRQIGCFGGPLLFGFYPPATRGLAASSFSLIVCCDVFEHSHEPEAFLAESARLLKPGGQLLLMMPLAAPDLEDRFFAPEEHVYIHSLGNMAAMIADAGFASMDAERWCPGHDLISARKL